MHDRNIYFLHVTCFPARVHQTVQLFLQFRYKSLIVINHLTYNFIINGLASHFIKNGLIDSTFFSDRLQFNQ